MCIGAINSAMLLDPVLMRPGHFNCKASLVIVVVLLIQIEHHIRAIPNYTPHECTPATNNRADLLDPALMRPGVESQSVWRFPMLVAAATACS
jgi:hypothetical protein